jgi:SHS2 domain-containing protein
MADKKSFEFLEHTADAYIAAYGRSLAEAFENAATAMFEVMTDVEKVNPKIEDSVEVAVEDEYALLYNWLEALLVKFEINGTLYSKFKILELNKTPNGFQLKAKIWGEKYNPKKHLQKVGVKSVTYHRMEIIKEPDRIILRFILDI